jgi:hypothetical protein
MIAAHIAIAIPLAWYLSIWSDEGSSLYTTQQGFLSAFREAAVFERQAPLYFWFLSLWREINGSIFFARIPSIVASAAAIWTFGRFYLRHFSQRSALLATAFIALHPILFWASAEIRVYAFVILISTALINLFLSGFIDDADNVRRSRLLFTGTAIVALYTNYYLGFLLAGFFVALLVIGRWRGALAYVLLMCLAGIAFLPMLSTLSHQFNVNAASFADERSFAVGKGQIWGHVLDLILPADLAAGDPTFVAVIRLWLLRAGVVAAGVAAMFWWRSVSRLTVSLGAVVGTILAFLMIAYFALGPEFVLLRHATVLFVPLVLFLASFLNDIAPTTHRKSSMAVAGGALLVCGFFSYAFITHYPNLAKPGDWARVGTFIEQNESPNQPIVIFHTYDAMTLPYEYNGVNEILPKDHFLDFDLETATPDIILRRTSFTISQIPPSAREIWLLTNYECGSEGTCDRLESYVADNYDTVIDKQLYMQRVRLLSRRQTH